MKIVKKIITILLVVALCVSNVLMSVSAETRDNENEAKVFKEIRTIADLKAIDNDPAGNYRLMADIDMTDATKNGGTWDSGSGWVPLKTFWGEFDGNGYRIKGMHIYGDAFKEEYLGLFSVVRGKVYNLGMMDVDIDNTKKESGYSNTYVGAIAGRLYDGTISKSYSSGKIKNSNSDVFCGGLIGTGNEDSHIRDSYNIADVDGNGIIGNGDVSVKIENCYNAGKVKNVNYFNYDTEYSGNVGYGIGITDYYNDIKNGYSLFGSYDNEAYVKANGTVLTETQMQTQSAFTGFDFKNTWEMDPNSTYKYPQLKENRQQRVDGVEIVTEPQKTVFGQGDDIDVTGGTVKITYEDGYNSTVVITKDMLTGYDMSKVGVQQVMIEYGGRETKYSIEVKENEVSSIIISGRSNELQKGTQMKLTAEVKPDDATNKKIIWSSSDTSKAVIDEGGNVKALSTGDVVITATASNGITAQYSLKVTVPCVFLILDKNEIQMYNGESKIINKTLSPVDTTDVVKWKSSNESIATVGDNGKVTAVSAGKVKITATAGSKSATCNVTIKQKLSDFYIVGLKDMKYTGNPIKQDIEITDGNVILKNGKDYKIVYSDNTEVGNATVTIIGLGYYEGKISKEFKISGKKNSNTQKISVGKVKIKSVNNIKKGKMQIKFKSVKKADGYQIKYSSKANMTSCKMTTTKNTTYEMSSLKFGTKYYVQVRAYRYDNSGKTIYGKWSVKKAVKVK